MAARPSCEGHLRLAPVLWPTATEAETVRYTLTNPKTNNRIKMQAVDADTGEEVSCGDFVKGYQIAKDRYVLFTKEEFEEAEI